MANHPPPVQADPDFRSTVRADSFRPSGEGDRYRRLVVNAYPGFLLVGVLIAGLWNIGRLERGASHGILLAPLVVLWCVALFFVPRAFRYQCLDCGACGRLAERGRHICPDVAFRITTATPARGRPPGVLVQIVAEGVLLAILLAIVLALFD